MSDGVLILITVLVITFVVVGIAFLFRGKGPRISQTVKAMGGRMKWGKGIIPINGRSVAVQYIPEGKNTPPELIISVDGNFGADLKIRPETSTDRFYKSIGLNKEPQVADPDLNNSFYFECDVQQFVTALFARQGAKEATLAVFDKFASITITKKSCSFKVSPSESEATIIESDIRRMAGQLLEFTVFIPPYVGDMPSELAGFKQWKAAALVLGSLSVLAAFAAFIGGVRYQIIDDFAFWNATLNFSVPVILAVSAFMYWRLKGFSTSAQVLIVFFLMFAPSMVVLFRYGGAIVNAAKDSSSVMNNDQQVIDKYTTRSKSGTHHHVVVQPWNGRVKPWTFDETENTYQKVIPGQSRYRIETRSGLYGFEWLISENLHTTVDVNYMWAPRDYRNWYPFPMSFPAMPADEFEYFRQWTVIMQEGIDNRMAIHEYLEQPGDANERMTVYRTFVERQTSMLKKLEDLKAPERLVKFKEYVLSAGEDQLRFYEGFAAAKANNPKVVFNELRQHPDLVAGDKKLWAAYYYFKDQYPNVNKVMNDAIERRLAWFDIV